MGEAKLKLEAKIKKFEENPEKFLDQDEVVMAVKVEDSGELKYLINPNHAQHLAHALGLLTLEAPIVRQFAAVQAMKANNEAKNRILTPGGDNGKIITNG